MKRGIILPVVVIICALSFSALPAQATLITIEIEAEVDSVYDPSGYLEGNISAGDTITGTYTYESTTADTNPSPYVGDYEHFASPAGIFLSVGEFDFTTDLANVDFLVSVCDAGGPYDTDNYLIRSYNNLPLSNGTLVDHISWQLDDDTATALSNIDLPTSPPILDNWQAGNHLRLHGERGGYIVDAHVTSAVPEPATIVLFAIGALLLKKRY
jgi:hypothetical protein